MEIEKRPVFHNYVGYDNKIWFWDIAHNGLFFSEAGTGEAVKIPLSCYAEYPRFAGTLYTKILLYKNKLFLPPYNADKALIYEPDTQEERYITLPEIPQDEDVVNGKKYWDIVAAGKVVFMIGNGSPYIIRLNLDEERVDGYVDLYRGTEKAAVYFRCAGFYGDKLIVPSSCENIVFIIDMQTLQYTVKTVGGMEKGFYALYIEEDNVWLTPRQKGFVTLWNIKTDEIKQFYDYPESFDFGNGSSFGSIEAYGEALYLFPLRASAVLRMDKYSGEFAIEELLTECIREQMGSRVNGNNKCIFTKVNDGVLFLYCGNRSLIEYSFADKMIRITELQLSEEDYHCYSRERICAILGKGEAVVEEAGGIREFLKYILDNGTGKNRLE